MDSPSSRFACTRIVKGGILAVSILVTLGTGELVVRSLGLVPSVKPLVVSEDTTVYKRSTNPILSIELKANYRDDDADSRRSYRRTNAYGQRDIERKVEKSSGIQRILLLGDSVVEGHGIGDIDRTMSRQLESLYPDGKTEMLNFGVSGYCTRAEIELLEVKGLQFQPDAVFLVFVENDFRNFNPEAFQLGETADRPKVIKGLFLHSVLFRLLCLKLNLFQFGAEADPVRWNKRAIGDNNVVDGLSRLVELAERDGFEPVIAVWPSFTDDAIQDVHFMPNRSDELVIERLARMFGIRCVRLSAYFAQHLVNTGRSVNPRLHYTQGDQMHPSEEGCRVAAGALKAIVETVQSPVASPVGSLRHDISDVEAIAAAQAQGGQVPSYAITYNNLGNKLAAAGRLDQAVECYRLALQANPEFAKTHNNLGMSLQLQGDVMAATRHFRRAIEIDPNYGQAHLRLGHALESQGQLDEALRHCRLALQIAPDNAAAHYRVAVILIGTGRAEGAGKHLQEAARLKHSWVAPINTAAWLLATHPNANIREPREAVQLAQQAAALTHRQDATVLDTLAAAFAAEGQFDQAVLTGKEALSLALANQGDGLADKIRERLVLYRQGTPYRNSTPSPAPSARNPSHDGQ